jgi:arabinofuranan 3-O-arabinosyltransferase
VRSADRTSRHLTVTGCPKGCWLVLGEGFNPAWSASSGAGDLGPPQLVDGGFNGWWIEPSARPVDVVVRWTAQGPLTAALVLSAVVALGCLLVIGLDRRRAPATVTPPPRFAVGELPTPWRTRWFGAAIWVVAAGVLVGPGWALVAAVAAGVLVVGLGQPRLAGLLTLGILTVMGAAVVRVVLTERPWPDAGWPVRFERLNGLGLFAAVALLATIVTGAGRSDR